MPLKNTGLVGDASVSDLLEANLKAFFDFNLLGKGGFFTDESVLRMSSSKDFAAGTAWEGVRKDWAWEHDAGFEVDPIRVTGATVNGVFTAVGSGVTVDYPNGRVIFDAPKATNATVSCRRSNRLFQFLTADDSAWHQIQNASELSVLNPQFQLQGSGAFDILAEDRIQTPAVIIEAVPNCSYYGRQLGGGDGVVQDVLFHILATERRHLKWMHDCVASQWSHREAGYDKNLVAEADAFPLTGGGMVRSGARNFRELCRDFPWTQMRFETVRSTEQPKLGKVWWCTVRMGMGVDLRIR